ncbi:MAG: choice-of-anchor D domain-containing protein [Propionibacteriales bacterium]|nr:choice-of-anchor D domain-containing protein [Propionibacteriales bacterium]
MRVKTALLTLVLALAASVSPGSTAHADGPGYDVVANALSFGIVQTGTTAVGYVEVKNTGSELIRVVPEQPAIEPQAPFSIDPDVNGVKRPSSCYEGRLQPSGFTITINGSCYLYYSFSPTSAGTFSGISNVLIFEAGSMVPKGREVITMSGTGQVLPVGEPATVGSLTVTPTTLAFGNTEIGAVPVKETTVTNFSEGNVQVRTTYPATGPFAAATPQADSCVTSFGARVLAQQQSCKLYTSFSAAKTGYASGSLVVKLSPSTVRAGLIAPYSSTAVLTTKTIAMSGTGVVTPFTLTPTKAAFGDVTLTGFKEIVVRFLNEGGTYVTPTVKYPATGGFGPGQPPFPLPDDCFTPEGPRFMGPGGFCDLRIRFSADSLGSKSGTIVVESRDVNGLLIHTANMAASARVISGTSTLQPTSLAFGNVTQTGVKEVSTVVTNTSTIAMRYRVTFPAGSPFGFVSSGPSGDPEDCDDATGDGKIVFPGETCHLRVKFTAGAPGAKSATITLKGLSLCTLFTCDTNTVVMTKAIRATATSVAASYTLSPTSLSFSTVRVGLPKTLTTVVKNTSTTAISLRVTYPAGSPFSTFDPGQVVTSDCVIPGQVRTIQPGESCNLRIRFAPVGSGYKSATVKVDALSDPQFGSPIVIGTKNLTVSGTGA